MIHEIRIPELGVNDESAKVVKRHRADRDRVKKDDLICEIETSKAAVEIHAEHEGFLLWTAAEGASMEIQATIALVADTLAELEGRDRATESRDEAKITRKALDLLNQSGISIEEARARLGAGRTLRVGDVLPLVEAARERAAEERPKPLFLSRIAVLNATEGGLCVAETAREAGIEVVCLLDDRIALYQKAALGIPLMTVDDFLATRKDAVQGVFVHQQKERKKLQVERFESLGLPSPTIIHPRAAVAASARVGEGALVKSGAIIDTEAEILEHAIVDNGAVVAHHCRVGAYSHVTPGVSMGGSVRIGDGVVVGIGARISPGITLEDGCIILPGATVRKNVPKHAIVERQDDVVGWARES